MQHDFRWNAFNLSQADKHGLAVEAVEYVVNHARKPYPRPMTNSRWLVNGVTSYGRRIEVIYVIDPDKVTLYVIHAH